MELTNRQMDILYGMILGDAYLQKTGSKNARLRIEHSLKQKEYAEWKYEELEHIFQSEPQFMQRIHPVSHRTYDYVRLQSYASAFLGELRERFYKDKKKIIPMEINSLIHSSLTIAVWYMDDGYYDKRDNSTHIYLQAFDAVTIQRLINAFKTQLGIECKAYCRPDRQARQLNFRNVHKNRLFEFIAPHLITSMRYKLLLDPVTTDREPNVVHER